MNSGHQARVESDAINHFAGMIGEDVLAGLPSRNGIGQAARINLDPDSVKNGLGQLVLTLVTLIHELLERQAIRRIEAGSLSEDEIERLGVTLMRQGQEIARLCQEFGLEEEDLNLDLGPLGKLL